MKREITIKGVRIIAEVVDEVEFEKAVQDAKELDEYGDWSTQVFTKEQAEADYRNAVHAIWEEVDNIETLVFNLAWEEHTKRVLQEWEDGLHQDDLEGYKYQQEGIKEEREMMRCE